MTRKDYVALAGALAAARPPMREAGTPTQRDRDKAREDVWADCVRCVGDVLAADNPRFDRSRFALACLS